jgi:hypothetical protein
MSPSIGAGAPEAASVRGPAAGVNISHARKIEFREPIQG